MARTKASIHLKSQKYLNLEINQAESMKYRWLTIRKDGDNQQISKILPNLKIGGTYNTINCVMLLQRRLGVSQSGTFGTATQVAVKNFQSFNGLTVDGIVGKNTWTNYLTKEKRRWDLNVHFAKKILGRTKKNLTCT